MMTGSRRQFLKATAGVVVQRVATVPRASAEPPLPADDVQVDLPLARVPLSFVIDDSTCLVNMGHFCMPQFAEAWPDREIYRKPWQQWPREIPDGFVREFGEWCAAHGVKGKYSIVPYPACVGWLDRGLPGWSRRALDDSLKLVRELMVPNWDIHPEMITHTRVIDLRTGRPMAPPSSATMENSYPQTEQSIDELASYLAYALRILKNCELPCEGITTPGGFGNRMKPQLPQAVYESVRDVYGVELPHFFKYVAVGDESPEPTVSVWDSIGTGQPRVSVSVPAGTGDWFGGWDGDEPSEGFRYSNDEATEGRMVELIERAQPAIMLCHWPGLYSHGTKQGYEDFKRVVLALQSRFSTRTLWMKMSEIARYWAARQLTKISRAGSIMTLDAPLACDRFTLSFPRQSDAPPRIQREGHERPLERVATRDQVRSGAYFQDGRQTLASWNLGRGETKLIV